MVKNVLYDVEAESVFRLEIEACTLCGERTYAAVCYGNVLGMLGIGGKRFGIFEGAVEHDVAVRCGKTPVNVYGSADETGDFAHKAFKTLLDVTLDVGLFGFGKFWLQGPENDVFYHVFGEWIIG